MSEQRAMNVVLHMAFQGAAALANADLSFDVAMKAHELVNALKPAYEAIEAERVKITQRTGDNIEEAERLWAELMVTEQSLPLLPVIRVEELGTPEERKLIKIKGHGRAALQELGALLP